MTDDSYKYLINYSEDNMKTYALDYAYGKVLKGMSLFSIGVITIGLAAFNKSNEFKANLMYILGGVLVGSYGVKEGWKGIKIMKKL